jgi:hypothetical protein
MNWGEALWWVPSAAAAVVAMVAVAAVAMQPPHPHKKYWMAAVLVAGLVAIGAGGWQQATSRAAIAGEAGKLHDLMARLDAVGHLLPAAPGAAHDGGFATVTAGINALKAKIADLQDQVRDLKQQSSHRTIVAEVAAKLADFLRQSGSYRVVVSCVPDDVEAFDYANRIANVLRAAGWDASGPEKTTIFGEAPAMGVKLFVRSGVTPPPAVDMLITAFTRFNIPYQSGVTPNDAIPDPATVELFVAPKP